MLLKGGCDNLAQDFHISFAPDLFKDSFHALLIFLEFQLSCSFHANTWEKPVHNLERTLEPQNGQLQFVYIKDLRVLFGSIYMQLDKIDIKIAKELFTDFTMPPRNAHVRRSFRSLASSIKIDQHAIRNRIRRLQEQGVIRRWYIAVNPAIFGL